MILTGANSLAKVTKPTQHIPSPFSMQPAELHQPYENKLFGTSHAFMIALIEEKLLD